MVIEDGRLSSDPVPVGSRQGDRRYGPIAITAAITGADVLPSQSPAIPCGVEAIVAEAVAAASSGAACVHLHARDDDGRPTAAPEAYAAIADGIRQQCDVVINVTTGGAMGMSEDERLAGIRAARPDIATFNLGTMNYELFPDSRRRPKVKTEWEEEILADAGNGVLVNSLGLLRRFAAAIYDVGAKPELEAYDIGDLYMARFLIDEGTLKPPVRLQMVLGVLAGTGNALDDLVLMKQAAERILGEDVDCISVAATGFPMQFRDVAVALGWGMGACRVGLEDSLRVRRDRPAKGNAELVEVAVQLADLLGRPVATPSQLRASLMDR